MAKKALINKQRRKPKFRVRAYTRCQRCGRSARGVQEVHALPHLLPPARARRGASGGDEVLMVTKAKFSSNVSDPVADLLTRIRNANLAYKDELVAPVSKLNDAVLKILATEGFIERLRARGRGRRPGLPHRLEVRQAAPADHHGLKRVSTPGRRVYVGRGKLPRVLGGLGVAIVSTSQGVMTDRDASRKGIGGEVLALRVVMSR